jgi:hypothetical protein
MITDQVISIKWAKALNEFDIKKPEDLDTLAEFRSWYTKASSIDDVPQPYQRWVLDGLPAKLKTPRAEGKVEGVIYEN